ncbi:uncharacterized protein At1g66480 [Cornus florida]|uniref:uncharacterized protein At1g66480 n=1 Tax=Cornus florida TaxID=4283 RepID=UPI00289A2700|nr:uncharacterized protein At1g66480 [Cornus florida]
MGNSLGWKKTTKIMKINGDLFKLKTPVRTGTVIKDYPGHVLLESEAVKHFGIRAKPLELHQELKPKRLYFLVELPVFPDDRGTRRVRSGINMTAKDRLESLMLSRRSASDLAIMKPASLTVEESREGVESGTVRVKLRLPKSEVARLMRESKDEAEAGEKIVNFCMGDKTVANGVSVAAPPEEGGGLRSSLLQQQVHWKGGHGSAGVGFKVREKRVGFLPINNGAMQLGAAS